MGIDQTPFPSSKVHVSPLFNLIVTNSLTDWRTNGPTDSQTRPLIVSRPRLKVRPFIAVLMIKFPWTEGMTQELGRKTRPGAWLSISNRDRQGLELYSKLNIVLLYNILSFLTKKTYLRVKSKTPVN